MYVVCMCVQESTAMCLQKMQADVGMSSIVTPTSKNITYVCLLQGCGLCLGRSEGNFWGSVFFFSAMWVWRMELKSTFFLWTHHFSSPPYIFWDRISRQTRSLLFWLEWLASKLLGSACLCPQIPKDSAWAAEILTTDPVHSLISTFLMSINNIEFRTKL